MILTPETLTDADRRGLAAALAYSARHPNADHERARDLADKIGARSEYDTISAAYRAERRSNGAAQ